MATTMATKIKESTYSKTSCQYSKKVCFRIIRINKTINIDHFTSFRTTRWLLFSNLKLSSNHLILCLTINNNNNRLFKTKYNHLINKISSSPWFSLCNNSKHLLQIFLYSSKDNNSFSNNSNNYQIYSIVCQSWEIIRLTNRAWWCRCSRLTRLIAKAIQCSICSCKINNQALPFTLTRKMYNANSNYNVGNKTSINNKIVQEKSIR